MTGQRIARLLCCMAIFGLSPHAAADVGGRGRPMTPYRDLVESGKRVSLTRLKCEMLRSRVTKSIQNFDVTWPKGAHGSMDYAGLAYVDTARADNQNDRQYAVTVFHHLAGKGADGKTVQVEFNRLELFPDCRARWRYGPHTRDHFPDNPGTIANVERNQLHRAAGSYRKGGHDRIHEERQERESGDRAT